MTNILLLEDEPVLRSETADFLRRRSHRVDEAATIAEFKSMFDPSRHEVLIIDLGLPDGNGLDLVRNVRTTAPRAGIIILTAQKELAARVNSLTLGADHFVSKANDLAELEATIVAISRRLELNVRQTWVLQSAPRQLISPSGNAVSLSNQDHTVLLTIAKDQKGASRADIATALGAKYVDFDQRRLDTCMSRMRRKVLEACGAELPITTNRNVGYAFHEVVELKV